MSSLKIEEVSSLPRGPFDPHDGTWAFPKRNIAPSGCPEPENQTIQVPLHARQQQEQQLQM